MNESIESTVFADLAENRTNLLKTYVSFAHARPQDVEGEEMLLQQDQAAYSEVLTRSLEGVPQEVHDAVMQKEHQLRWDAIIPPDLKGQTLKQLMGKVAVGALGTTPATLYIINTYGQSNPASILFPSIAVATVTYAATKQRQSEVVEDQKQHKQAMMSASTDIPLDNQLTVEKAALETTQVVYDKHQKFRRKIAADLFFVGFALQYAANTIIQNV